MKDPVAGFLRHLAVEKNASPHTVRSYRADLADFARFLTEADRPDLARVDGRAVRAYLASLHARGLDAVTAARRLAALRSLYRFLVRRGEVATSPARDVRGPRIPRKLVSFLPIDEAADLVDARALGGVSRVRDVAILELLYATGVRVSELAGLDVDALDRSDRTVRVLGKGRKERQVPYGEKAAAALEKYLAQRNAKPAQRALLLNHRGGRLSDRGAREIVKFYARMISGDASVHPHSLRHAFATHLLADGAERLDPRQRHPETGE
jgi:integrase/recombinase XerC